eukprot:107598-Rhodomonas_salina.2
MEILELRDEVAKLQKLVLQVLIYSKIKQATLNLLNASYQPSAPESNTSNHLFHTLCTTRFPLDFGVHGRYALPALP